jgi:glycosyltransferase involved in cell wall biosynthesis
MVTLDTPLTGRDGIRSHVWHLSRALVRLGCEVWVVGLDPDIGDVTWGVEDGVQYVSVPCGSRGLGLKMLCLMTRGVNILGELDREVGFDVVHGHGGYSGAVARLRTGAAKVMTQHTSFEEDQATLDDLSAQGFRLEVWRRQLLYPGFLMAWYRRWYLGEMSRILTVTRDVAASTSEVSGLPMELFEVARNGVELSEFEPGDPNESSGSNMLFYGRLAPRKGVQVLLRAFSGLAKARPDTTLTIVGEGPYLPRLKEETAGLGISGKVSFTGRVSGDELAERMRRCRVVVIPSLFEGFPITLLEAAAMGKPIVVSRLPGVEEVMKDDEDCVMVEPGDVDGLTDALLRLTDDAELRRRIGRGARATAEAHTWEKTAKKVIEVYEDVSRGRFK